VRGTSASFGSFLQHKVRPVIAKDKTEYLHRTLHVLVDSAIAADDAISENDPDGLAIAMDAIDRNIATALGLYRAWRLGHV